MKAFEGILSGLSVMHANKLRSILTILGIVIGIAGVIAMMSFGDGAKRLIMWEVEKVGGMSVFGVYRPGWIKKNNEWVRNRSHHFLNLEDAQIIQAESHLWRLPLPR